MEQGQQDRKYEWNRDKKTDNTNGIGTTRQTIRMEQGQQDTIRMEQGQQDRQYEWNRDKRQTITMEQGQKDRQYEWNRDKKTDNMNGIGTKRQKIRMEYGQKD